MAFGEPRIDAIDNVSGWLSSIDGRVRIVGARLRMHLTEDDVRELEGIFSDCDEIRAEMRMLRSRLSQDYLLRIGKGQCREGGG